jgi:hypothetical protein
VGNVGVEKVSDGGIHSIEIPGENHVYSGRTFIILGVG